MFIVYKHSISAILFGRTNLLDTNKKNVTIAIITCRRPIWLNRLLQSLIKQEVDENFALNILVVDNACDPKTKEVVDKIQPNSTFPVIYQTEETPGIVAARNKCVSEFLMTDSQYLLFIDDDEWPEHKNWAQELLNHQIKYNSDVVTSHIISVGETGTPPWAIDLIYGKNKLKTGDDITIFYTNNLLICRHVLENIQPAFDSRFAMTGASDYHFALKCYKAGYKASYANSPVIEEFPASRATVKWFMRRGFRSGIGFTRSHLFEDNLFKAIFYCLALSGVRTLRGIGYLLLGIVTFNKKVIVDGLFRLSSAVGTIAGFFGVKHEEYRTIHGN